MTRGSRVQPGVLLIPQTVMAVDLIIDAASYRF